MSETATHDGLLRAGESEATLDCGCVLRRDYSRAGEWDTISLTFCAPHAAVRVRQDEPIQQIFFNVARDPEPSIRTMSVQELMDTNAGYEDSAVTWLEEMARTGMYDDSDPRTVVCWYIALDIDKIRAQYREWAASNPEIIERGERFGDNELPKELPNPHAAY